MTDIKDTIRLARAFGEQVQSTFRVDTFREICDRNKGQYADSDICATHDFCDANMAMAQAFKDVTGRDADGDNGGDATLWNDAWELARKLSLGSQ